MFRMAPLRAYAARPTRSRRITGSTSSLGDHQQGAGTPVRGAGQPQGGCSPSSACSIASPANSISIAPKCAAAISLPAGENAVMPDAAGLRAAACRSCSIAAIIRRARKLLALARAGWDDFAARQREARQRGRHARDRRRELSSRAPDADHSSRVYGAALRLSGKVHVYSGAAAMGQSTKTMLAQVVAEQLGGDMAQFYGDHRRYSNATSLGHRRLQFAAVRARRLVGASAPPSRCARKCSCGREPPARRRQRRTLKSKAGKFGVKGAERTEGDASPTLRARTMGTPGFYLPGGVEVGMEATEHAGHRRNVVCQWLRPPPKSRSMPRPAK